MSSSQLNAINAFRQAGNRWATRREDDSRAEERRREIEQENERQRRMRERAMAPRPNGSARAGDIDGIVFCIIFLIHKADTISMP